jgi:hypothetical protein
LTDETCPGFPENVVIPGQFPNGSRIADSEMPNNNNDDDGDNLIDETGPDPIFNIRDPNNPEIPGNEDDDGDRLVDEPRCPLDVLDISKINVRNEIELKSFDINKNTDIDLRDHTTIVGIYPNVFPGRNKKYTIFYKKI